MNMAHRYLIIAKKNSHAHHKTYLCTMKVYNTQLALASPLKFCSSVAQKNKDSSLF